MRRALTTPELRRTKPTRNEFLLRSRRPITVVLDGVAQNYNIGAPNPDLDLLDLLITGAPPSFPTHLKLGEKLTAPIYCEPIKVQVDTNMGSLIYTFEE
jgi:hypothetical protein